MTRVTAPHAAKDLQKCSFLAQKQLKDSQATLLSATFMARKLVVADNSRPEPESPPLILNW